MSRPIVLASASPRRKELLTAIGLDFTVDPSSVDEAAVVAAHVGTPQSLVVALAAAKACDVLARYSGDELVIGADTIVVVDGIVLGKPADAEDAVRMLMLLSGRVHEVFTGISVAEKHAESGEILLRTAYERTLVTFAAFDEAVARRYVATGEPLDKAGSYGIQAYGAVLIPKIEGDYFNVVGLPLHRLSELLAEFGVDVWKSIA